MFAVGQLFFNKKTISKLIERSDLWLPEAEVERRSNWMKIVKWFKLPVRGWVSIRDVMHNKMYIINTTVCYIWTLLREWILRVLIIRKKIFFYFTSIWDAGCSLNLVW